MQPRVGVNLDISNKNLFTKDDLPTLERPEKAICTICKVPYGEVNLNNHVKKEVVTQNNQFTHKISFSSILLSFLTPFRGIGAPRETKRGPCARTVPSSPPKNGVGETNYFFAWSLLLNLSTRPPTSTSFCLPVKNG